VVVALLEVGEEPAADLRGLHQGMSLRTGWLRAARAGAGRALGSSPAGGDAPPLPCCRRRRVRRLELIQQFLLACHHPVADIGGKGSQPDADGRSLVGQSLQGTAGRPVGAP
jgi:hypothetical protein